ncbi:MAG TPA: helix-turn-helix domain-containing protein [Bryobacteraceae bacterium]|nr:helix-turn-helix domain-containing protein [Bryobacteraceae bacterium]
MPRIAARYREYAPCEALRGAVRAFFSFSPADANAAPGRRITREILFGEGDSFCSPMFADGHVSIVFSFPRICRTGGLWHPSPAGSHADVLGAMTVAGPTSSDGRDEIWGAYLRPAGAPRCTGVPAADLTDRIVALDELWGPAASELIAELSEQNEAAERIDRIESALLRRTSQARTAATALNVPGLAAWVMRRQGGVTVERMGAAAGVSRQHLTRVFRESVGVTPKLYCRLARFQSGLVHAGSGSKVDWAREAVQMGYADQSHMIAEFRRFSSLTPGQLASQNWFHPFIERARAASQTHPR